jgi:Arc/MetJ family transcription regulator
MISQRCEGGIIMTRTIVDLDEKVLKKAMKLSGIKTKVTLVNLGLKSLVRHLEQMEMLKSKGTTIWEGDLDEMRGRVRR